jgi:predicted RNA-binding protein with PUA-like domain
MSQNKAASTKQYWLMKSEPDVFSFQDLKKKERTLWDGVRNYMARNYMMKNMRVGDVVLFYHSNAEPSGIAGLAQVSKSAQPDPTAFDKKSKYYDPKSKPESPRWQCVEVSYLQDLPREVSLTDIKQNKKLQDMVLLKNSRLSVQPVLESEYREICRMAGYHE